MSQIPRQRSPTTQTAVFQQSIGSPLLRTPTLRAPLLWLTLGVAGAVLFTVTYLIEGVTRPGYSAWRPTTKRFGAHC